MSNDLERALAEVGFVCVEFKGRSMNPLFVEGRDKVCIYSYKPEAPLKKGDIVLYKRPSGEYVLHRIMAKKGDSLTMCGDNHTMLEKGVKVGSVLGVCAEYYKGDELIDFSKSKKYKLYKNTYGKCLLLRRVRNVFNRLKNKSE